MISLGNFGACPGTRFVDQTGLGLTESPASASQVLGLKAWVTSWPFFLLFISKHFIFHLFSFKNIIGVCGVSGLWYVGMGTHVSQHMCIYK